MRISKIFTSIAIIASLFVGYTQTFAAATIADGTTVTVDYIGKFEDGTVFDTSIESVAKTANLFQQTRSYKPFSFVIGKSEVIVGFENAVKSMTLGETKTVTIEPKDGYGEKIDPNFKLAGKKLVFTITLQSMVSPVSDDLQGMPQGTLPMAKIRGLMKNTYREGATTGTILMIEYSDPACPFCIRQFADNTIEQVMNTYPTQVEHIYKPVEGVNHPSTEYSSFAILCAGKIGGKQAYKDMYSAILSNSKDTMSVTKDQIATYVKSSGIDESKWNICMTKKQMKRQYVANWNEFKKLSDAPGTPSTLIINKHTGKWIMIAGAYPVEIFKNAVDLLLK